jgi:hypothetical protein
MDHAIVELTFNRETLELDVNAPDLTLDVVISIVERAKRMLENQEKIVIAQQISQGVRAIAQEQDRTEKVLSRVKLH